MAAKDFAFLFYPGEYLRDTQCLSEGAQVAYDRIMCEHMRNICISQTQFDFFTKRLDQEQKNELKLILDPCEGGFCIPWVVEQINKRRDYSESRRKNRGSEVKKEKIITDNISTTYDPHMVNVIVNENEDVIVFGLKKESRISIKKVYAGDKVKIIYDLRAYFADRVEDFARAGWTAYDDFMAANPAAVFEDDNHLYNSYRKFCTTATKKSQHVDMTNI